MKEKNIQKRIKPELFLHFHFRTTLEKMNLYIKEVTGSKYYWFTVNHFALHYVFFCLIAMHIKKKKPFL